MPDKNPEIIPDPALVPPAAAVAPPGNPSLSPAATDEEIEVKSEKAPLAASPFVDKVLPLSTKKEELEKFNGSIVEREQKINMVGTSQDIISNMDFAVYWKFRQFQIENIKGLLLEHLRLQEIVNPTDQNKIELQNVDSRINALIDAAYAAYPWTKKVATVVKKIFGATDERPTFEERKEYLEKIIRFYTGISIEIQPEDQEKKIPQQIIIQKEDPTTKQKTTLVTINQNSDNTITFKIPSAVITGDPGQLDHAISLMMDQATRTRERSWDLNQKISGWHNRPDIALRMYQLAMLNGSIPKIADETIAAWKNKVSSNDPRAAEFANAIKLFEIFEAGYNSPDPMIAGPNGLFRKKLMEFQTLKDLQQFLGHKAKAQDQAEQAKPPASKEGGTGSPGSPMSSQDPSIRVKS